MSQKVSQEEFNQKLYNYTNNEIEIIGEYINKRTPVKIKCKKCGYIWNFNPGHLCPSYANKYRFSGCPECKYTELECNYCHKKFKRLKSELSKSKSGRFYCSKECGNRDKNENYTNKIDSSDYRRNAFEAYPHKCAICGCDEDERVLEVHHIDEDRKHNHIDNLIILCPICHKKLTLHLYALEELKK